MKNSRFDRLPYGSANRAVEGAESAISAWWGAAAREKLGSGGRKKGENSDRSKRDSFWKGCGGVFRHF